MENRRNFIKATTALGAGLFVPSIQSNAQPAKPAAKLKTRTLGSGKNKIEVSSIGRGCMGMSYHRSFIPDKKYMVSLIHKGLDMGVTFFDTAEAYGPYRNEELVGEALGAKRKDIVLCTKFGFKIQDGKLAGTNSDPKHVREVVEQSLKRLRTDYIDLLYQHRVDPNVPVEDVAGTVKDMIKEGKVKHFGMSEASSETIRKAHAVQPLTALQSEYSLMTRQPENDVIKTCQELGIGFVPYSPLSRGFLSGYITENTKYNPANDNRPSLPRYQADAINANWVMIDTLKTFGDQRGLSAAQVALAWLMAQKPWIVPIPGTTKLAHLQENLWAMDYQFTPDELRELTADLNKITIVGDRYSGQSAERVNK